MKTPQYKYYKSCSTYFVYRISNCSPGVNVQQFVAMKWLECIWISAHDLIADKNYVELFEEEIFLEMV